MNVSELMTYDVATCSPTDSLNRAAQLMWERRSGCIPVVDDDHRVVGVITDRDVGMAAYTQGRRIDDIAVTTAMSQPPRVCAPDDGIEHAEDQMMAHGVRRLVVVDADGHLQGVLSLDDVARIGAKWDGKSEIDLERVTLTLGEVARRTTTSEEGPEPYETTAAELVRNSVAVLKTLRDEIRVDLNLASKDARDRWKRLEVRLRAAEACAKSARPIRAHDFVDLVEHARVFRHELQKKPGKASSARRS